MSFKVGRFFIYLFMLFFLTASCHADNVPKSKSVFGIKVGLCGEADIRIDNHRYSAESGTIFGAFLDLPVYGKFYGGFAADIGSFDVRVENSQFLDLSLVLKAKLGNSDQRLFFRPAIAFGYGMVNKVLLLDETRYFTFQIFAEMLFMFDERLGLLCDIGWMSAPSGGDGTYSVTTSPRLMWRGGIVF
ncbi:MAG: hypothetical protein CVT49_11755 [candidate division Zixibacteria bacterium HGW-Zixibacteria-1]|nr:MAG: hypothetical protein CVT49_11755 [candidate division Zixibacteria bacterium HGW-Zixibacteria-1]